MGIALLCPLGAWAADQPFDIRPGLWSITSTVQISGLPPIPNLDQMTPEQRARVEAMMKNMAGGHTNTTKSCVTRQSIDKAIADASSNRNATCAPKLMNVTDAKVQMHIDCTQNGETKSTGDINIERQDAEHFKGNGAIKSSGANGRVMDMKMTMNGVFVSSDCGSVKPRE